MVGDALNNLEIHVSKQVNQVPIERQEAQKVIETQSEQISAHDRQLFEAKEENV